MSPGLIWLFFRKLICCWSNQIRSKDENQPKDFSLSCCLRAIKNIFFKILYTCAKFKQEFTQKSHAMPKNNKPMWFHYFLDKSILKKQASLMFIEKWWFPQDFYQLSNVILRERVFQNKTFVYDTLGNSLAILIFYFSSFPIPDRTTYSNDITTFYRRDRSRSVLINSPKISIKNIQVDFYCVHDFTMPQWPTLRQLTNLKPPVL